MARGKKKAVAAPAANGNGISPEELRRVLSRAEEKKEAAKGYSQEASAIIRAGRDDFALDAKALAFVRAMLPLEPLQQQARVRAVVEYAAKLGMLAQGDLFAEFETFAAAKPAAEPEEQDGLL